MFYSPASSRPTSNLISLVHGLDGDATGKYEGEQDGANHEAKGKYVESLLRKDVREGRNIIVYPLYHFHMTLALLGHLEPCLFVLNRSLYFFLLAAFFSNFVFGPLDRSSSLGANELMCWLNCCRISNDVRFSQLKTMSLSLVFSANKGRD